MTSHSDSIILLPSEQEIQKDGGETLKYDVLEQYREFLQKQLTPNTAKTYYAAMVKLFRGYSFNQPQEIYRAYLEKELPKRFATRNELSAAKNALKRMQEYYPEITIPNEAFFQEISKKKRNFSKKPRKVIYLHPTQRKINQMQNQKLKYAYRLAIISGLRVSELADLEASDIALSEGKIMVTVKNGKGGHGGTIRCRQDPYLYEQMKTYLQEHPSGKLFYKEKTMEQKAGRLGFECHDLRRIYAIESKRELKKEMTASEADQIVQQNLRHNRFSTTKRYLYNRKLRLEYEQKDKTNTKL